MAYRAIILHEAQREYENIVEYLSDVLKSPQAAIHYIEEFAYQLDPVRSNPCIHALSRLPELAARGYRSMLVNSYIALYKVEDDVVVVAHIFHQSQDYARLI